MRRVFLRVAFLCLSCPLFIHGSACAATIYDSKGFEAPPFVAGQALESQDPADGPWVKTSSTSTATVINNASGAAAGQQFVQVTRGANSDGRWAVNKPQLNVVGSLVIEWDMFVPTPTGSQPFGPYYGVEAYDSISNAPLLIGSAGIDAKTGEFLFQESGTGFINVTGLVLPFNVWHHFEMVLDYSAQEYSVLVNGTPAVTESFVDPGIADFSDAPIAALAAGGDSLSQAATETARFDNYLIRTEPSSFVVTNINDPGAGGCTIAGSGDGCTLREAITAANSSADESIITFAPGVIGTINLTSALPALTEDTSITGPGIAGASTLTVRRSTGGDYRIFTIGTGSTVSISDLIISNGNISGVGGGVLNDHGTLTLARCSLIGNVSDNGGGALFNNGENGQPATTTVISCNFSGNSAAFFGGVIYNDAFNGAATLIVRGCTFVNNAAGSHGGALYSTGANGTAILQVTNSTFDNNEADNGGAIYNEGSGGTATATIQSCTFNENNADFGGSAIWSNGPASSTVTISNNIFRVGTAGITLADGGNGTLISQGFNIASDGAGDDPLTPDNETYLDGTNDRINTDPLIGPLALNGGLTQTHALLPGSPAINQGNSSLTTDQRGVARPQGRANDIGAYEAILITIGDVTITEGDSGTTNAVFSITLSAALPISVSVNYNTVDNASARPVSDYNATALSDSDGATPGTLTIPAGQTTGSITVPIVGDTINEATELFYVLLSSPSNAIFSKGRAACTINDNDVTLPALTINDVTINEGNSGLRNANFTVRLNAPSGRVVSVNVASVNGTAIAGVTTGDYISLPNTTIKFTPGQTQRTVTVAVNGDTLDEANETFFVNLGSPQNATIDDNQGVGIITDDDRSPALSINDISIVEGQSGTKLLTFTVSLSENSAQTVTVNYATANGTAKTGSDYVGNSGTLTFAPAQLTQTISITINGDVQVEVNEVFYVILSSATNASISRGRALGTIQNDDISG